MNPPACGYRFSNSTLQRAEALTSNTNLISKHPTLFLDSLSVKFILLLKTHTIM